MKVKRISVIAVFVLLAGAMVTGIYVGESRIKPDYTVVDAVEDSIIVLTGEYPDKPESRIARVSILALLFFGVLIVGVLIAKMSSLFVTRSLLLMEKRSMKNFKDHIVICNWNRKAEGVISQILDQTKSQNDIVVVNSAKIDMDKDLWDDDNVSFIQDDPAHHNVLLSVNAHKAKSVLILADDESGNPDEKNALIALAVKHLEEEKDIGVHIVAEVRDPRLSRHLKEAGVDELISNIDLNTGILAQSALFANMSDVYQRLLSYSDDTNELYFIDSSRYPAEYIGKSFPELRRLIEQSPSNKPDEPLILLGVKQDNEIYLNPKKSRFPELKISGLLIIMTYGYIQEIT